MKKGETIEGQAEVVEDIAPEQLADLAALEAVAAADIPPGGETEAEPGPAVSSEESLAGLLVVGGMAAGMMGYKRVAAIWNEPACRGFSDRACPVLRKYSWGMRVLDFLDTGAGVEEMALLMYAAPLVLATMAAAKEDAADMRPAEPEKQAEPEKPAPYRPESMPEVHEVGG